MNKRRRTAQGGKIDRNAYAQILGESFERAINLGFHSVGDLNTGLRVEVSPNFENVFGPLWARQYNRS